MICKKISPFSFCPFFSREIEVVQNLSHLTIFLLKSKFFKFHDFEVCNIQLKILFSLRLDIMTRTTSSPRQTWEPTSIVTEELEGLAVNPIQATP